MAIIPKNKYPANTSTSDAAYPHGKARNQNTPGDGTGTPLEADWINDLWGFLQALLAAGGIAPSNLPDKVGTSQYLDAIKALINKLADQENTWFADQFFQFQIHANDISFQPGYGAVGISYEDPPTVKKLVPLRPAVDANGWSFNANTLEWTTNATSTPLSFLVSRDVLPGGAMVKAVRAGVRVAAGVGMSVRQFEYNTATAAAAVAGTDYTDAYAPTGTEDHILAVAVPDDAIRQYSLDRMLRIHVVPAGAGLVTLRWIEVEYVDYGISNQ